MNYNHEYHLAETVEQSRVGSQKIAVRGTLNSTRILQICLICGIVSASLVFIGICIRQLISQSVDNQNSFENVTANDFNNISAVVYRLAEEEADGERSQHEKRLENSLSPSEIDAIRNLRSEVEDQLTSSYMKTASYLIRWLRARNWDVEDAKDMLLDHLEFRAEYDMDSVFESNLTFFEAEYPVYEDGTDYQGGPVVCVNLEDWDLRRITVGGYERDFFRYFYRLFERGVKLAEDFQSKGANITQGMFILNMNNYSTGKHGCFSCLPLVIRLLFGMDENYPGWLHHIFVINSSDLAGVLIDMALPYINGENRAAFHVHGFNKAEWQPKILSLTAADQIRPEFGGTKIDWDE